MFQKFGLAVALCIFAGNPLDAGLLVANEGFAQIMSGQARGLADFGGPDFHVNYPFEVDGPLGFGFLPAVLTFRNSLELAVQGDIQYFGNTLNIPNLLSDNTGSGFFLFLTGPDMDITPIPGSIGTFTSFGTFTVSGTLQKRDTGSGPFDVDDILTGSGTVIVTLLVIDQPGLADLYSIRDVTYIFGPEPASWLLTTSAIAAFGLLRWRRS